MTLELKGIIAGTSCGVVALALLIIVAVIVSTKKKQAKVSGWCSCFEVFVNRVLMKFCLGCVVVCLSVAKTFIGLQRNPFFPFLTICKITRLTAHFLCGLMSDLLVCKFIKCMVIHDTECPYWDQVSLNNTNQTLF